ncbi:hypothetical protein QVD17_16336 [Tagetes erecta]|uniref:Dof zinc finger protein n=1 Tax=Tagetes erecta TaxID=13708 RepID=A0AAD8KXN1_TARER|nr:hypothetical protein QVD17_16336 [Tagetes erecta]
MQASTKPENTTPISSPTQPPMTKRLKTHPGPDQDQDQTLVHCPRCDSPNTKFCYYNNYSLSQPRYFCKSCRRYWTKGGTLRNIPIGGVSRKNKRLSSVSATNHYHHRRREQQPQLNPNDGELAILSNGTDITRNSFDLQLSYPSSPIKFSTENPDFLFEDLTIDFMDKGCGSRGYNGGNYFPFMASDGGYGPDTGNIHGSSVFSESMPYYDEHYEKMLNGEDVKPKVLDLEWRDQTGCHSDLHGSGVGRNGSYGYIPGLGGLWAGLFNGYGSSSTNPLV